MSDSPPVIAAFANDDPGDVSTGAAFVARMVLGYYDASYPPSILAPDEPPPAPVLTSMNVPWITPEFDQVVQLTGTGFTADTQVRANGVICPTTYVSDTQVNFNVGSSALPNTTLAITARNGASPPSNTLDLPVGAANPELTSINPNTIAAGAPDTTITCTGSDFVARSVVQVNGTAVGTTYISATALSAVIPLADLATAGSLTVRVATAAPGGGNSTNQTFTVT